MDYPVPGGTLRENMHGVKGQNLVKADHPAYQYKWDVRKENGISAFDARRNGLEMAKAAAERAASEQKEDSETNVTEKLQVLEVMESTEEIK